ncbi:IS3 family transposase, partial [Acinetobacter sp. VNK23]|uniref:IS3 family transposase n=1 Tax=Acinetobacter thutiue TaxID=2998078 RepID=UPI0025786512
RQAQDKYGIQGCSTVLVWLRKHGNLDWSQGTPSFHPGKTPMPNTPLTPEQRIKELEQQLADTQQKAEFFEAVVDVLKRDYGVSIGKKATRQVIREKRETGISIMQCCRYLGMTRQAYYKQCRQESLRFEQDHAILKQVQAQRMFHPRIGTRKLHYLLNQTGSTPIGRDYLFDLLRFNHLLIRPKRAYHKTTNSHHRFHCHPNRLKTGADQVIVTQPEQLWVADITYLPVKMGEAYISLVTDAWSRKIVGYHVHGDLKTDSVIRAYKQALKQRKSKSDVLTHHSDRGIQYCAEKYQRIHKQNDVQCSMTDGYDCYQNAMAERINGILKNEYLLQKPANLEEARRMVAESIGIYNTRRSHLALNYKTP